MTASTTARTRKTTKATADTDAPVTTDQAATPDTNVTADAPTDRAAIQALRDAAPDTAPAYTIPDWSNTDDMAAYVASVGESYRNADKGTKAAMRAAWAKFQSDALQDLDVSRLALVRDVNAVLVTSRPVVEVDPADAYVIQLLALDKARDLVLDSFRTDHDADTFEAMRARYTADEHTDDETKASDALAAKLATVRTTNRRTGPQRSVESHIRSALEAAPKGTILTCAQIHNHRSDAYGPDEAPSVGAIGAAHGREMDGIVSTENASKVKGFKLA